MLHGMDPSRLKTRSPFIPGGMKTPASGRRPSASRQEVLHA